MIQFILGALLGLLGIGWLMYHRHKVSIITDLRDEIDELKAKIK